MWLGLLEAVLPEPHLTVWSVCNTDQPHMFMLVLNKTGNHVFFIYHVLYDWCC